MSIKKKLAKSQKQRATSLWEGPESSNWNGGVSQSMLHSFLVCRERFRIKYVLGLGPPDDFNHSIEFGNLWHACEEALSGHHADPWKLLDLHVSKLLKTYPMKQEDIIKWYEIVKLQFPIYVEYWKQNDTQAKHRKPILQEGVFCEPYVLPSGRTVFLKGKWDAVDLVGGKIYLQENKTKGTIEQDVIMRQLSFDLQTMLYLSALQTAINATYETPLSKLKKKALGGVRYNVIRRPLSGGKGSIRQKKNQTLEEYYDELAQIITNAKGSDWGMPEGEHYFFMRWKVDVSKFDVLNFQLQFLSPILEQLCSWWNWVSKCLESGRDVWGNPIHWRAPYGTYSPLYNGKPTDVDHYLETGSTVGLVRKERLFRELEDENELEGSALVG